VNGVRDAPNYLVHFTFRKRDKRPHFTESLLPIPEQVVEDEEREEQFNDRPGRAADEARQVLPDLGSDSLKLGGNLALSFCRQDGLTYVRDSLDFSRQSPLSTLVWIALIPFDDSWTI
jgi:hypothetical protein